MIKIQTANHDGNCTISVEGGITDVFAAELERCWRSMRANGPREIVLDLARVTRVDAEGREVLMEMYRDGVLFVGARLGIEDIVHDVQTKISS